MEERLDREQLLAELKLSYDSLIGAFLRDRKTLLVLDNCEQILAAAPQIAELLAVHPCVSARSDRCRCPRWPCPISPVCRDVCSQVLRRLEEVDPWWLPSSPACTVSFRTMFNISTRCF